MRRIVFVSIGLLALSLVSGQAVASAGEPAAAPRPAAAPKAGPSASQLLAKISSCRQISNGKYKTDTEKGRTISVCGANGAVFWKADMDIDCDGVRTSKCNEKTDPWWQNDTHLHDSKGKALNAEKLPYVVLPSPSGTFDYNKHNVKLGGVVAIIYNGKVTYAVSGDTGPKDIIGEASYAAAVTLGINPNPATGGAESGVSYIVFQGSNKVSPPESHAAAVRLGERLANEFVGRN
jgi:hypothetical protein